MPAECFYCITRSQVFSIIPTTTKLARIEHKYYAIVKSIVVKPSITGKQNPQIPQKKPPQHSILRKARVQIELIYSKNGLYFNSENATGWILIQVECLLKKRPEEYHATK
jgi:hypothetical protein